MGITLNDGASKFCLGTFFIIFLFDNYSMQQLLPLILIGDLFSLQN